MQLIKDLIQVIGISLGLLADPALSPKFRLRQRRLNLAISLGLLVHLLIAPKLWGTSCLLQGWLGFPCPTCGSTRATCALMRGDLSAAFHWHPLIPVSLLILLVSLIAFLYRKISDLRAVRSGQTRRPNLMGNSRSFNILLTLVLVLYLLVYFYRLVRLYPNPPLNYNWNSLLGRLYRLLEPIWD